MTARYWARFLVLLDQRELATGAEAAAAKARAEDLAAREQQLHKDVERRELLLEQLRTPRAS